MHPSGCTMSRAIAHQGLASGKSVNNGFCPLKHASSSSVIRIFIRARHVRMLSQLNQPNFLRLFPLDAHPLLDTLLSVPPHLPHASPWLETLSNSSIGMLFNILWCLFAQFFLGIGTENRLCLGLKRAFWRKNVQSCKKKLKRSKRFVQRFQALKLNTDATLMRWWFHHTQSLAAADLH